ncbi:MAG TPA: carbohydrate kinase family protein, partial [Anaerolineae bacterium]|nr:carbohydrate kinase family protein [Anaerolineae bacterium]
MNIVVTGSIAYDYLMRFPGRFVDHILPDQLHHLSLSFLVDEMRRQRGGCAANIAYNLALLGERPRLMGTVGQDFDEYRRWLEQHGVDTSLTREEPDLFTASFFVSTDQDGNQIASFYTGAMARARDLSLRDLEVEEVDLVVISPNDL